ncbi:MAG: exodeoxyribonuclease III [Puniceicoccales bacterium]|nr:exodeoxyribonuclease III [Puniceicoccales bacterium]
MRIVSWNVNGLRAILGKGFREALENMSPDILCLQEIKIDQQSLAKTDVNMFPYEGIFNPAVRKGYSGTAVFSRIHPTSVNCQTKLDALIETPEGRVILLEYANFYLVNVYTPNSGENLRRLNFRHDIWDIEMLKMLQDLRKIKPVILCGDMNAAHKEIDLENPAENHFFPGFTDEEREGMTNFLEAFGIDAFRKFYPNKAKCYSWWSYRMHARERNIGWRIDYTIVDKAIADKITSAFIRSDILGSDHAPVGIDIDLALD